jgi:sporulation protein YlmC with PRC-barrel domain
MNARVSDLQGRTVMDTRARTVGYLCDIVARLRGDRPPAITGLLVQRGRYEFFLPMDDVGHLASRTTRLVLVAQEPKLGLYRRHVRDILLVREVMDRQVIDLRVTRPVRVNDLLIAESNNGWEVAGVALGVGALVRRRLPRALRRDVRVRLLRWTDLELLPRLVP